MKTKNTFSKLLMAAALVAGAIPGFSQTNLGSACGCPAVGSRPTTTVVGDITTNTTWNCNTIYVLDKKVYVTNGATLTIQPGTLIKATPQAVPADASALIISRGSKINAVGSESCPIVFTAQADPMNGSYSIATRGQWGGVVLLGRASNNVTTGTDNAVANGLGWIEGTPNISKAYYGADLNGTVGPVETFDDADNSGVMKYVSIRHGGAVVATNVELNGLSCGSVGSGTTLEHIDIVANADDGIEFFGGTVNLKYASLLYNDDDGLDWDEGYTGKIQFAVVVNLPGIGNHGIEADGDDNNSLANPISRPILFNATFVTGGTTTGDAGMEAKENTGGDVYNSIFVGYNFGLRLRDNTTNDSYDKWLAGTLNFKNNTLVNVTTPLGMSGTAIIQPSDLTKFSADGNTSVGSVTGADFVYALNTTTNAYTDPLDLTPNPALSPLTGLTDGFFDYAPYRGAFAPTGETWLAGWSHAAIYGIAFEACPTDLNGDGITNNSDFLQLLGKFNQFCK